MGLIHHGARSSSSLYLRPTFVLTIGENFNYMSRLSYFVFVLFGVFFCGFFWQLPFSTTNRKASYIPMYEEDRIHGNLNFAFNVDSLISIRE